MKNKKIKKGLTPKMKKILHEIQAFNESNGYSPSYEELKQLIGLKSKSNIHRYVHTLKKRGYIDFLPAQSRSMVIL
jgi:repressor LexA